MGTLAGRKSLVRARWSFPCVGETRRSEERDQPAVVIETIGTVNSSLEEGGEREMRDDWPSDGIPERCNHGPSETAGYRSRGIFRVDRTIVPVAALLPRGIWNDGERDCRWNRDRLVAFDESRLLLEGGDRKNITPRVIKTRMQREILLLMRLNEILRRTRAECDCSVRGALPKMLLIKRERLERIRERWNFFFFFFFRYQV